MSKKLWFITTKTNLHVGNESASGFGLIDLAVQRNATTELPCINSSSLKGALNEFAAKYKDIDRFTIFGSDKKDKSKGSQKGKYIFYDADLLFMPAQDEDNLYKMTTSIAVLLRFKEMMELFNIPVDFLKDLKTEMTKEEKEKLASTLKEKFGFSKSVVIVGNKDFSDSCDNENLPIIARNVLDNGESKNLWYEQVVPAEAVFYTVIDHSKEVKDNNLEEKISKNLVQIGANATIGYGYCVFCNIDSISNDNNQ